MFVEKTVDKVYEIEYGETHCYRGNYSDFEKQKKDNYQKQLKDHEYQKEEIARLMRLVERFRYKATKASMVQSKLKQIERMKIIDKPDRYDLKSFHASFTPRVESVKDALIVKDLSIGYQSPLATINLELLRGKKLGVIGENGIGKSTFLKTITGELQALSGKYTFGLRTEIGYFNQQMAEVISDKTVFEDFQDAFPRLDQTQIRTALGSFLFSGEDVFKRVKELSGGERVRLALCKLFKKCPNFLILDEPTNHMDIVGKETLENMLCEYTGTVIFVSHDRYLVNKVADCLLVFDKNGTEFYPYGYSEYELIQSEKEQIAQVEKPKVKSSSTGDKKNFSTPLKDKSKKQKRVAKLETLIQQAESDIESINTQMQDPSVYSDYVKVTELQQKLESLQALYDEYSLEWLTLLEELENID
jgi:ATP-binding cassette subfamily F protein 3